MWLDHSLVVLFFCHSLEITAEDEFDVVQLQGHLVALFSFQALVAYFAVDIWLVRVALRFYSSLVDVWLDFLLYFDVSLYKVYMNSMVGFCVTTRLNGIDNIPPTPRPPFLDNLLLWSRRTLLKVFPTSAISRLRSLLLPYSLMSAPTARDFQ